jgi:RimJ/RimL family protein N-acetyltransferase
VSDSLRLEPWGADDRWLMERLLGDPRMTEHLGGPESPTKLAERQARYEQPGSRQYKVMADGQAVGGVGYWEKEWRDQTVWEVGWLVLPEHQGRGYASGGMTELLRLIADDEVRHEHVHAFPGVENAPSNSICRKLGFTLLGPLDFEYPPGSGKVMSCNDWRLELRAGRLQADPG